MKKIIASLKRMPLRQILTVFLAGIALLINTACSQPKAQAYDDTMKGLPGRVEPEVSGSSRIKTQPKSGMNSYSDVDPRVRTTGAEEKAQELVENAERNVIDQTADVGTNTRRILDKKGENLDQSTYNRERDLETAGDRARGTLDEAKDTAAKYGENVKSAAGKATGNAQAKASEAASNTRQATRNATDQATSAVKGTTERAQARTAAAAEDTQEASGNILDRVTKSVKRATEDASDFVENKTEQAAKGTQQAVEDASDAAS